jgi:hypothetical protein
VKARPKLLRAVGLGLGAGLLLAAVCLGVLALLQQVTCVDSPGSAECAFEQDLHAHIARVQALAALGCALVGGGLTLLTRR